jgi:L-threonylcarbamoyladenylate synthase
MKTTVWRVDAISPDPVIIRKAAEIIRNGGLVAFPTETVYGLGANALNAEAVSALFEAKKRPLDNPPIVHVSNRVTVERLVKTIPSKANVLMEKFWPGPLTLVFKRSPVVPDVTVAGLDTIAVRMPRHNVALALIEESSCPIAAPSANLAGKPSPTSANHVLADLDGRIDAILDAGSTNVGVESTVLDLTVDPPEVLRPGGTSYETLVEVLGEVKLNPAAVADSALPVEKARSPGIKHKHYSPNAEVIVVEGELMAIVDKINGLAERYRKEGERLGVLCTDETVGSYTGVDVLKSLGSRKDFASLARNLFRLLREFDEEGVDVIIAEGVPSEGLGLAVMNRLRKAAGYKIIRA